MTGRRAAAAIERTKKTGRRPANFHTIQDTHGNNDGVWERHIQSKSLELRKPVARNSIGNANLGGYPLSRYADQSSHYAAFRRPARLK
jgi:hypothetical protein